MPTLQSQIQLAHQPQVRPSSLLPLRLPNNHCRSREVIINLSSPLETKYRIICPICYKKTITYDLRHLIINSTEQD